MIKEAYISFEVAKLLKEHGFNWNCITYYVDSNPNNVQYSMLFENNTTWEERCCSAPTHQMAMKWLREREKLAYNILIIADGDLGDLYYSYEIQEIDNEFLQVNGSLDIEDQRFNTYEEAVEAALKYVLRNLI